MAVFIDISMSLDGYVAGPNQTLEEPLGEGGEQLHEWVLRLEAWREPHGLEGGESGPDGDLVRASIARTGAVIMGRRMFSGGSGPWADDPNADAWWGDNPPFHVPVFVLTHHEREPLEMEGGTTFYFVTDGIESALGQAREAAGDRDISIAGGAQAIQQYLAAGLIDELEISISPLLLGGGERLLDNLGDAEIGLEQAGVVEGVGVTHISYGVVKG